MTSAGEDFRSEPDSAARFVLKGHLHIGATPRHRPRENRQRAACACSSCSRGRRLKDSQVAQATEDGDSRELRRSVGDDYIVHSIEKVVNKLRHDIGPQQGCRAQQTELGSAAWFIKQPETAPPSIRP
jgi:hypothetical protein